jgi:16S rRNA processing protein RimM
VATVTVGRVLAAHGVRGELRFEYRTDFPERISQRPVYMLRDPVTNELTRVTLARVALQKANFIAGFAEFSSREQAAARRGWLLEIAETDVPDDTGEDEFYYFQLHGLDVVSSNGAMLGRVVNVIPGVAHVILEYEDASGERKLVAFTRGSIAEVNLDAGRIVLRADD